MAMIEFPQVSLPALYLPHFGSTQHDVLAWHAYFMRKAQLAALKSKDPSSRVGAAIADANFRDLGTGYNGFPRGVSDTAVRLAERNVKYRLTLHAEDNALAFAGRQDLSGCRIYSTHHPCAQCMSRIIQRGLREVFTIAPSAAFAERWGEDLALSREIAQEAGVVITEFHLSPEEQTS